MDKSDKFDESMMPSQSMIDDPAHDEMFPEHPLSIARAAKQWYERAELRVEERPVASPRDATLLRQIECSISAPPRFTPGDSVTEGGDVVCLLNRVSFCGTDGVDRIFVVRTGEKIRGLLVGRRLVKLARERSRAVFEQLGHEDMQCQARPLEAVPPAVEVVIEGDSENLGESRGRMVWRWFLDDTGRAWGIGFLTTVAVPLEEISEEVAAVARSWNRLDRR